ncbi:hypothetical protein [Paraburkholderia adhaesiva]|uniref:hypothetical protein n=1 Tax=Paraburkholderia adhaesiva TaxID=2883244 RepID=UPI001F467B97|nr:hypothetical protein [Paraburkholderia adhaesiva]
MNRYPLHPVVKRIGSRASGEKKEPAMLFDFDNGVTRYSGSGSAPSRETAIFKL